MRASCGAAVCDDRRHMCVEPKAKSRNTAQFITPGITPKFRSPQVCRLPTLVVDARCGSNSEVSLLARHALPDRTSSAGRPGKSASCRYCCKSRKSHDPKNLAEDG